MMGRSRCSLDAAVTLLSLKECPLVPKKSEVVAQAIVHDIVVRRLRPGDRLASEAEMMEE